MLLLILLILLILIILIIIIVIIMTDILGFVWPLRTGDSCISPPPAVKTSQQQLQLHILLSPRENAADPQSTRAKKLPWGHDLSDGIDYVHTTDCTKV